MQRALSKIAAVLAALLLAGVCTPAYSLDPLTLILLRILRDKVLSAGIESAAERAMEPSKVPVLPQPLYPALPLTMDDAQLQRLIDEGFVHLTWSQRREVYESVRQILLDPKNAAEAPALIADLAIKASAVRQAHESLSQLSAARKRRIAQEAGEEYQKMPEDTRDELASVLRARMVPMPGDLTDMILAEFDRVKALTAPAKQQ